MASPVDYSQVTGAVDFDSVISGILAVALIILAVLILRRGIWWIQDQISLEREHRRIEQDDADYYFSRKQGD